MISIALRNLFAEKTRFAISVGGVAFSVMLILIIISLYQGWRIKSGEYIGHVSTDLWVTQKGSADITNSASIIGPDTKQKLTQISGIKEVNRFIGRPIQFKLKDKEVSSYIVGLDTKANVAGPEKIISGRGNPDRGEIIVDKILARSNNLSIGDFMNVLGRRFEIVGIGEGANMFLFQFSFVSQDEAIELFKMGDLTNYFLVKTESSRIKEVQTEINNIDGIEALTKEEFINKNRRVVDEVFLPIISVLVFISLLVGTAVIGLTIYTSTVEKSREFGVIKALGASNYQIYRIIFEQALVAGFIGYFVGVGFTYLLLAIIPNFIAVFVTVTRIEDLIMIFFLSMGMSVIASYTPVRRIVRIDPALVFKS